MGLFLILPLAALAGWIVYTTRRQVWRPARGRGWRMAFIVLSIAGAALGLWFAHGLELQAAQLRLEGFPVPLVIHRLHEGRWSAQAIPAPLAWIATMVNVACGPALALLPLKAVALLRELRDTTAGTAEG